jgi:type II secretory pathway pseudopilin PulG
VIIASAGTIVGIVVVVLILLLVVFFIGGYIANSRRREALDVDLRARIEAADAELAAARAQDKGWERATIEAAARAAVAPREVRTLHLVQVVDRPGTDADQAVFRVVDTDGSESTVTLGRRDGSWVAV